MTWQLGAFAILAAALAGGFAWYERSGPDARIIALVGTLAAFAALGRIAFAAIPNVKPTTDIVLASGYALGGAPGFAVGAIGGLASNFFFGQGPWTPWQMAGWGATGLIGAGLAVATRRRIGRWPLALVCAVVGFAFTALQDVGDWVTYSDHSLAQLGVYVGRGIGFDSIHAVGCLVFALAFGPALIRSLARFSARLQVTWRPAGEARPGAATSGPRQGAATMILVALIATGWLAGQPGGHVVGRAAAASTPAGYLLAAQNPDGGFGPAPGSSSSSLFSGWAALGLAAAGENPQDVSRGGHSLIDYIRGGVASASDPGSLERTILVVRAAGVSAQSFGGSNLVSRLRADIRRNGSVSNQVNLTAFAVMALRAAGEAPPSATLAWLARQQDSDGGFNFATRGGSSDVDDTGAALEALAGAGGGGAAGVRSRAVRYLRAQQDRDGGFASQPGAGSNAQSTAFAVQGLLAAGVDAAGLRRGGASPLDYLRSLIAPDGHVRYSRGADQTPTWVTAEALMALDGKALPLAAVSRRTAPAGARSGSRADTGQIHTTTSTSAAPRSAPSTRARAPALGQHGPASHPTGRAPARSSVDPLAVDAGVLTALSLAFVN